jgi:hypothetical protein
MARRGCRDRALITVSLPRTRVRRLLLRNHLGPEALQRVAEPVVFDAGKAVIQPVLFVACKSTEGTAGLARTGPDRPLHDFDPPDGVPAEKRVDALDDRRRFVREQQGCRAIGMNDKRRRLGRRFVVAVMLPRLSWPDQSLGLNPLSIPIADDVGPSRNDVGRRESPLAAGRRNRLADKIGKRPGRCPFMAPRICGCGRNGVAPEPLRFEQESALNATKQRHSRLLEKTYSLSRRFPQVIQITT